MKFAYGSSDLQYIIENNMFYVDRTHLIPAIEDAGQQIIFLRPRRFGKSLCLSMLENYYDIAKAEQFESLFGHLAIGKNPTPLHNHYIIMRWDFSLVGVTGNADDIERRLHEHINKCIADTCHKYQALLNFPVDINEGNAVASFQSLVSSINNSGKKLYLLIDEYDNFANDVMMGDNDTHYETLLHGEGVVRTVFKAVKGAASGMGLERVFITGVSPIAMSDITSAYNVATNIYLSPKFNQLCGFTEKEIANALHTIIEQGSSNQHTVEEVLNIMRMFYNGYRFCKQEEPLMYNATLAIYFLRHFAETGTFPENMLDENLAMDSNKIHYIAALADGREVIGKALDASKSLIIPRIGERFGVQRMVNAPADPSFVASLLYYLGALTITKTIFPGEVTLRIPNLVMRKLYLEEIQAACLPSNPEARTEACRTLYLHGNIAPLCSLLQDGVFQAFSNRDYRWSDEQVIKTAFLATLFNDVLFIMDSEPELNRGYADLSMMVRPDMRHYDIFDVLMEFKYVKLNDIHMTGEAANTASDEHLQALPQVQQAFDQATQQLHRYIPSIKQRYGDDIKLATFAVVAVGFNRLLWMPVDG
jgi:hypothetical protein